MKPFFATPYPGTEWYYTYKDRILQQYGGDLEKFLLDLGDATKVTAVISKKFNAVELYGLRELMVQPRPAPHRGLRGRVESAPRRGPEPRRHPAPAPVAARR